MSTMTDTTERFDQCSLCLFCYKPITENSGENYLANSCVDACEADVDCDLGLSKEKENGVVERFIKFLDRIGEPSRILSEYCGTARNAGVISCCNECGCVLNSFCEIYHQWKCLELRVEWRLGTIVNIMKFANKVPSRVRRLKKSFGDSLVDGGAGGGFRNFKNFRGNLIKKCAQTLSKSQPRVLLERRRNHSENTEVQGQPSNCKIDVQNGQHIQDAPPATFESQALFLGWSLSIAAVAGLVSTNSSATSEDFSTARFPIDDQSDAHTLSPLVIPIQDLESDLEEERDGDDGASSINDSGREPEVETLSIAAVAGLALTTSSATTNTNEDISSTRFPSDDQSDPLALSPLVSPMAEILESDLDVERDGDVGDGDGVSSINNNSYREPEVETIIQTGTEVCSSKKILQATLISHDDSEWDGVSIPSKENTDSIPQTVQTRDIEVKQEVEPENVENGSHFHPDSSQNLSVTTKPGVSQTPRRNKKFTPNSRFECPHCSNPYHRECALKKHIKEKHPPPGFTSGLAPPPIRKTTHPYHCSICSFSCPTPSHLQSHKQTYVHQYLAKLLRKTVKIEEGAHSKIVTSASRESRVTPPLPRSEAANETKFFAKRGDRYFCKVCKYSTPSYRCLLTHKRSQSHKRLGKLFLGKKTKAKVSNDVKVEEVASPTEDSAGAQQLVEEPPPPSSPPRQRYNLRRQKKVPSYQNMEEDMEEETNDEKIISSDNHSNSDSDSDSSSETDVTSDDDESVEEKSEVDKLPRKRPRIYCRLDDCSTFEIVIEKYLFKQHQQLHNPGEYKCNFCDTIESNVIRLSCHEREFHPAPLVNSRNSEGKEIFSCPRCNYATKRRQSYYWHFAEVHVGGFQRILNKVETVTVECEICKLKMQKSKLDLHFQRSHETKNWTGRIWRCEEENCPAFFKTERQRRYHRKKVHGIFPLTLEFDAEEEPLEFGTNNFNCNLCDKKCPSLMSLIRHKSVFHRKQDAGTSSETVHYLGQKILICPVVHCAEKFKSVENLETHKKLHGTFRCDFCSVTKNYAPELALHELEHATSSKNDFNCSRCSYDCGKKSLYVQHHLETHLSLKFDTVTYEKVTCPICKVEGFHRSALPRHFKAMHDTEGLDPSKIFRCDQCPAYFLRSNQLVAHKMKTHVGGSFCSICNRNYTNPFHLRLHLERAHPETLPNLKFSCDKIPCKRRFGTMEELESHKKIHEDEKESCRPVKCSKCGKQFKGKFYLTHHMKTVHSGRSHVCPECGKAFKAKTTLDLHLEYHKGPDAWKFQCAECGRKCVNKQKLKEHQRTHTKEKPFVCQYCGEKYAQRHNWKAHVKTKHPKEFEENEEAALERETGGQLSRKGSKKGDCILSSSQQK